MLETSPITPVTQNNIEKYFTENFKTTIESILADMDHIVPIEFSSKYTLNIIDMLQNKSSKFNKLWVVEKYGKKIIGFLVFNEQVFEGELYIQAFGFKKDQEVSIAVLLGNIKKIIKKAKKNNFKTISFHGFNKQLINILTKRYGFQKDPDKDMSFINKNDEKITIPYFFLDLINDEKTKPTQIEEKIEHDLSQLKKNLHEKMTSLKNEQWQIISQKTTEYLNKTKQTAQEVSWTTVADAIIENFKQVVNESMSISKAIDLHHLRSQEAAKKLRAELATMEITDPEILVNNDAYQLCKLASTAQLKQESALMTHCIGDDNQLYIKNIINGKIEIWSFRDRSNNPLITIEYDIKSKNVIQMKKNHDKLLHSNEKWFADLLEMFNKLAKLDPPVLINEFRDTMAIEKKDGLIITSDGKKINAQELATSEYKNVFIGSVELNNEMSDENIKKLCSISSLRIDTTHLSKEKKDKITHVEGNLLDKSNISLKNLQSIGGHAYLSNSEFTSLDNLQSIGKSLELYDSQIRSLNSLQSVGGKANFIDSQLTSVENLQSIGGGANFDRSQLTSLDSLHSIGEDAYFGKSQLTSLENLQSIGGNANFAYSQLTSLDSLQSIGRYAYFSNSQLTSLRSLQSIGINADFSHSQLTSLDNLQSIGGHTNFVDSQLTSLRNLQSIDGNADFRNSKITDWSHIDIKGEIYADDDDLIKKNKRKRFFRHLKNIFMKTS